MATLQKLGDKVSCPLDAGEVKIGRTEDNEIVVKDKTASGYHAVIKIEKAANDDGSDKYFIEDLNSTNHTYVNNNEISHHQLLDGDIIRIGTTRLKFSTKNYTPPSPDHHNTQKINSVNVSTYLITK